MHILKLIERIERGVVFVLVILGTVELGRVLLTKIISAPRFLVDVNTLFESFALFLVIVVGLEFLKSIKSYLLQGSITPSFVIEVAIITLGNKLITLDFKAAHPRAAHGNGGNIARTGCDLLRSKKI